jgi:fructose-bisphosphate aldolase, class II
MLQNLREVVEKAEGAVASFNIADYDMARAVLAAAAELESPIILGIAVRHWDKLDGSALSRSLRILAENAPVPVALHLDHTPADKFEILENAVDLGFTSVMIDGSKESFEENLAISKKAVALAHRRGVSVEAELGAIEGTEGEANEVSGRSDESLFTDPQSAKSFIEESGADALAVSVGTAHGIYTSAPQIRFDLIEKISAACPAFLVLHGATGIPQDSVRRAVAAGIKKINFFSGFLVRAMETVRASSDDQGKDYLGFRDRLMEGWKETAREHIRLYRGY